MSIAFPVPANGSEATQIYYLEPLVRGVYERARPVTWDPPTVSPGDDVQAAAWWASLQQAIDALAPTYLNPAAPLSGKRPNYWTLASLRAAAGMHSAGWTRWTDAGVMHGYCQAGDILFHPAMYQELHAAMTLLRMQVHETNTGILNGSRQRYGREEAEVCGDARGALIGSWDNLEDVDWLNRYYANAALGPSVDNVFITVAEAYRGFLRFGIDTTEVGSFPPVPFRVKFCMVADLTIDQFDFDSTGLADDDWMVVESEASFSETPERWMTGTYPSLGADCPISSISCPAGGGTFAANPRVIFDFAWTHSG